jgi:hypothetical protein
MSIQTCEKVAGYMFSVWHEEATEEDCTDRGKGLGYWGKTTNQSLIIIKTLSTGICVIASIAMDELQKVSHNLFMRCEAYLQAEGGQFQHVTNYGNFVLSFYSIFINVCT